jgi:hypothetical protein
MNAQQLLENLAERVSARASVKNVYGDLGSAIGR